MVTWLFAYFITCMCIGLFRHLATYFNKRH